MHSYGISVTQESILLSCKELKHWDLPLIFWRGKNGMQSNAFSALTDEGI